MKQTVDIINDFVDLLTANVTILAVTANPDGTYSLSTGCTWWLSLNDTITITAKTYKITEFTLNNEIVVTPLDGGIPTETTFAIIAPNYVHGTLKMSQTEVDAVNNKTELVPFIYLYEVVTDRKNTDEESIIDREVDLRIFFLNSADSSNWLTDDHYLNVINPMQQMVDLFISKITSSKYFTDEMTYSNIPLINLSQEGGQENSIFDCNLSGIELRLDAQIREDLSCENQIC